MTTTNNNNNNDHDDDNIILQQNANNNKRQNNKRKNYTSVTLTRYFGEPGGRELGEPRRAGISNEPIKIPSENPSR